MTKKYKDLFDKNKKDSFYTYLSKNSSEDTAAKVIGDAAVKKKLSDTNYGIRAESLAESGLSGSGYEEYLRLQGQRAYEGELDAAVGMRAMQKARERSGYEKYVSEYDKLQEKIADAVIQHFSRGESFSLEDAYKYAIGRGLAEEQAYYTAAAAVRASSEAAVERIIAFADKNHLTPNQARRYARNSGLDERYVQRIYDAVGTLTEEERLRYSKMQSKDYINYIKTMKG